MSRGSTAVRSAAQARRRAGTTTRRRPARTVSRPRTVHTTQRGKSSAAQKAYARRAQRSTVAHDGRPAPQGVLGILRLRLPASRASFVLLMMSLLVAGVVLTLWLSTQAVADSYRLDSIREETQSLAEQAERLQREVAHQQSAEALADEARSLGMVPSGHPARLVITGHGKPKLVGEPMAAQYGSGR